MNPADEAQAFASLIEAGASVEEVARRFGLTVRFVEGRLRLATLAPVVFEALASGEITLDMAKAYGATSDQEIQARVFEQVSTGYYAPTPDSDPPHGALGHGTRQRSARPARRPRCLSRSRRPDRARAVRRRRQRVLGRCRAARNARRGEDGGAGQGARCRAGPRLGQADARPLRQPRPRSKAWSGFRPNPRR